MAFCTIVKSLQSESRFNKGLDLENLFVLGTVVSTQVARPLVDETPFPNRVAIASKFNTPLPDKHKLAQLLLEANKTNALYANPTEVPDSAARRASSARAHVRAPRLSANNNSFETPLFNGKPWDVSEAEIAPPEAVAAPSEALESEDYDEIEYMPPQSVDAYAPPFDFPLPEYSTVGKTLLGLAHSYSYDDTACAEIEPAVESGLWSMLMLPDLCMPLSVFNQRHSNPVIVTDDPFLEGTEIKIQPESLRPPVSSDSRPTVGKIGPLAASNARKIRLGDLGSANNTTIITGAKAVFPIRRPATVTAMYPSKGISRTASKEKNASRIEFVRINFSFPELVEDFLFNV
ncbi:hypothetical protein C8F04DRAFT_1263303 [Mycena alexandri]|uniref:Uncharacterized protein n=1 Tax=Mycena alexandri TaxID=1745969 RepID=A0AAD6SSL6_9AGAR|nr:hypothetical protein C8F04DRAFT_1263303 [Mycena alexandri]